MPSMSKAYQRFYILSSQSRFLGTEAEGVGCVQARCYVIGYGYKAWQTTLQTDRSSSRWRVFSVSSDIRMFGHRALPLGRVGHELGFSSSLSGDGLRRGLYGGSTAMGMPACVSWAYEAN